MFKKISNYPIRILVIEHEENMKCVCNIVKYKIFPKKIGRHVSSLKNSSQSNRNKFVTRVDKTFFL